MSETDTNETTETTAPAPKPKTAAEKTANGIQELQDRRAKRKGLTAEAKAEQYAKDLEALDALEQAGEEGLALLDVAFFTPGLPTFVAVKPPADSYFNRFRQQVRKAGNNIEARGAATDMLASVCVAYPDEETYKAMRKVYPGIHDSVGQKAYQLGEGKAEDEGKG